MQPKITIAGKPEFFLSLLNALFALFVSTVGIGAQQIYSHKLNEITLYELLVKIITLLPALVLSDFLHKLHIGHFRDFPFDVISIIITSVAAVLFVLYLKNIKDKK